MEKTILIVDDDPALPGTLKALLADRNFHAHLVASVKDAIEVGADLEIDLILLDLRLPDGNGLVALRTLREKNASGRHPKVIVMSGSTDTEAVIEAKRLEVDDILAKPFDPRDLLKRIESCLSRLNAGDVRHLLGSEDAIPTKRPKIPELAGYGENDWSCLQLFQDGDQFLIVARKDIERARLAKADEAALKKAVLVFRATAGAWRAAWPTSSAR